MNSTWKSPTVVFLAKLVLLYGLWNWLNANVWLGNWVTHQLGVAGAWTLRLTGLDATVVNQPYTQIYVAGAPLLGIGDACNGVDFFGLFACFVLAFPAQVKSKYWFLPLGILFIHLLNVLRVVILCLNYYYYRPSFEFNHHYTFVVVVYGVMFLLWMKWASKYSLFRQPTH
jgi:exosortase family protein XrtF